MIRRMDTKLRLKLTDISDEEFDPTPTGKSLDTLMREIHGRYPDGKFVLGVDVFREIYARVGFDRAVGFSRWPVVRSILAAGYSAFAWPRYRLAMRRLAMRRLAKKASSAQQCSVTPDVETDGADSHQQSCSQIKSLTK